MRSRSSSSSRSPSPQYRKRQISNGSIFESILNIITIIVSISLLILIPYIILGRLKGNCSPYAIHNTFIISILFHLIMIVHDLIIKGKNNILTVWYNIHFHYFLNSIFLYYSGLYMIPFFFSVGSRSLFALCKALDNIFSKKAGDVANLVLSFTNQVINSIYLCRIASILEILEMPYLIISAYITSRNFKIIAVLCVNIFFLTICYQTDPYHKWVWQTIRKSIVNCANRHRDSFGPFLLSIVSIFDLSYIAQFLFPPIRS